MNLALNLLDVILVMVLVGYLIAGLSRGFFRSLASLAGFVLGAVAAFWAGPWISAQVGSELRIPFVLVTVLGLLALGQIVGGIVGNFLARLTEKTGLGILDRLGGGVLNVAVAAIVLALLGSLVGQLGIPSLSQQVAGSSVLRTIEKYTPEPVREAMTHTRDTVSGSQGIRQLDSLLFPAEEAPEPAQAVQSDAAADLAVLYAPDLPEAPLSLSNAVEQGNSGGPMLDANGNVVGVIFAKAVEGEAGYAIPMEQVTNILEATGGSTAPASTGECVLS